MRIFLKVKFLFYLQIIGSLGVVECALLWLGLSVNEDRGKGMNSDDVYENDCESCTILLSGLIFLNMINDAMQ